ncbi:MAG: hypothetical protein ACUZ8H_16075 [Candidatus Anammoxibacter sp.]
MLGRLGIVVENARKLSQSKILIRIWKDKEVQVFIVDLNRVDQLFKQGVDSLGNVFGLYASNQGTVTFKGNTKDKKRNSRISLFNKGDFYKTFAVKVPSDGFIITADDKKDDDSLTDIYGKEILGLGNESIEKLSRKIIPIFISETRVLLFK